MVRALILFVAIGIFMWVPWMDTGSGRASITQALEAFGPVPSLCFDSEGNELQDGLAVRWYPLGRLVHACSGDYVVWFWGAVKEMGGTYKKSEDIQPKQGKPLTCQNIVDRQEARQATTTDSTVEPFEGPYASAPDYSLHPEAEASRSIIERALREGPNFAGSFAVASWECGTNCQNHAIVDTKNGQVIVYGLQTEFSVYYSPESTLLITNPVANLPAIPDTAYEAENMALSIARVPREYYRLTSDALSGTQYLVKLCVESAATGYIAVEDDRIGVLAE